MELTEYIENHGSSHFVEQLLTRCQTALGDIPQVLLNNKNCYLAGQAVASAAYEILNVPLVGQYNDLDIFIRQEQDNAEEIQQSLSKLGFDCDRQYVKTNNSNPHIELNDDAYNVLSSESYQITSVVRASHLNLIHFFHQCDNKDSPSGEVLIDGFDLNAVGIAINLATHQLYYTTAFADFISTRALKVINFNTPQHSVIRFLSKRQQITGLDHATDSHQLSILASAIHAASVASYVNNQALYTYGCLLGQKNTRRYLALLQAQPWLQEHFDVEQIGPYDPSEAHALCDQFKLDHSTISTRINQARLHHTFYRLVAKQTNSDLSTAMHILCAANTKQQYNSFVNFSYYQVIITLYVSGKLAQMMPTIAHLSQHDTLSNSAKVWLLQQGSPLPDEFFKTPIIANLVNFFNEDAAVARALGTNSHITDVQIRALIENVDYLKSVDSRYMKLLTQRIPSEHPLKDKLDACLSLLLLPHHAFSTIALEQFEQYLLPDKRVNDFENAIHQINQEICDYTLTPLIDYLDFLAIQSNYDINLPIVKWQLLKDSNVINVVDRKTSNSVCFIIIKDNRVCVNNARPDLYQDPIHSELSETLGHTLIKYHQSMNEQSRGLLAQR